MRHGTLAAIALGLTLPAASGFATSHGHHASPVHLTGRATRSVWDSVFTVDQAKRGADIYAARCQRCHQDKLQGTVDNPPLAGAPFMGNWTTQSAFDLHDKIYSTMPSDSVGVLTKTQVTDLVAHVFNVNGFPAGRTELGNDPDSLRAIKIENKP